jgi:hypothetical protein
MEVRISRLQDWFNLARAIRPEKVLHERRGVGDDDSQEAFLAARSRLINSAAGSPRSTLGR